MATTIINPQPSENSSSNGMSFLIGAIILIILAVIFFVYGLPLIKGMTGSNTVQINVPKSIDVKVQQSK